MLPGETEETYGPAAELFTDLAHHAGRVVAAVHDEDPAEVDALLDPGTVPGGDLLVLTKVLAAMVDPQRTTAELLAWTQPRPQPLTAPPVLPPHPVEETLPIARLAPAAGRPRHPREHGTDKGYGQHRTHRDPMCEPCLIAHRVASRPRMCQEEFARLVAAGVPLHEAAARTTLARVLEQRTRPDDYATAS